MAMASIGPRAGYQVIPAVPTGVDTRSIRTVAGDDVAAGVFDDQRVCEPVGQAQRVVAGHDHVSAADDVDGGVVSLCRSSSACSGRSLVKPPAMIVKSKWNPGRALPLSRTAVSSPARAAPWLKPKTPSNLGPPHTSLTPQSRVRCQPSKPSCHQPKSPVAREGAST